MKRLHVLGLLALLATGCNPLPAWTSGQVGCAEEQIVITRDEMGFAGRTWTAVCRGKTFYCTSVNSGPQGAMQVSCKEEAQSAAPPPSAPPTATGCQYDTQCKGDRICKEGQCVDP